MSRRKQNTSSSPLESSSLFSSATSATHWKDWIGEWDGDAPAAPPAPAGVASALDAPVPDENEQSLTDLLPTIPAASPAPGDEEDTEDDTPVVSPEASARKRPSRIAASETKRSGLPVKTMILGGIGALLMVFILIGGALVMFTPHKTTQTASAPSPVVTAPHTDGWCVASSPAMLVSSEGGDLSTPYGVIQEFERQFFGRRSASGAAALTAGDLHVPDALQRSIDDLPSHDLEWCTRIIPADNDWWRVDVEFRPRGSLQPGTVWGSYYYVDRVDGEGWKMVAMKKTEPDEESL